ncbi:putative response regulatory protein [compost metagenome]
MIKVLIVDDEPKLREGLRVFIDWEVLGFSVVDIAANGNEALEKYKQYKPNLVIADIRMPGMDGLQLIQLLREHDPALHILILSGYADFDYAKKAITERADGYLLKPVDEDELISYLQKIKDQIKQEKMMEYWEDVTKEWNRESLVQSLLLSSQKEEAQVLVEQASKLDLLWKSYQILLVSLHLEDETDTRTAALLKEKLIEKFESSRRGYVFQVHTQIGVLLKDPILGVEMESIYMAVREALDGTGNDFSAALGPKVNHIIKINHSYSVARDLNRNYFFLGSGKLLCTNSISSEKKATKSQEQEVGEVSERLYYALDVGNQDAMKSLVRSTGQSMVSAGCAERQIKRRFVEILTTILTKALKQSTEMQSRSKEFYDFLTGIYTARTLDGLYEKTDFFLQQMMNQLGEGGKHREVKIMLDFIHRNFSDNLKLETLSGIFNYNSAYLGKLFKDVTGEYFNTYLDKVRIEKAKELLEEGLKVYQVAEKVGYTNVDYFHTKFRKYVGTSPTAYRKNVCNA